MSATLCNKLSFEFEQAAWNAAVWAVLPASMEIFVENTHGAFTCMIATLGAFEQIIENRVVNCVPPKARRIVPLVVTTGVVSAFVLTIGGSNDLALAASITSISSLTFALIKSVTNKPYPKIVPIAMDVAHAAKSFASNLPYVGHYFQERPHLL